MLCVVAHCQQRMAKEQEVNDLDWEMPPMKIDKRVKVSATTEVVYVSQDEFVGLAILENGKVVHVASGHFYLNPASEQIWNEVAELVS